MDKVNLGEKLGRVAEHWSPRIVGEINEMQVKVVRLLGEFQWHSHETQDEMFLVVTGELEMHYRDRVVTCMPGEFVIVPHGVEHKPVARGETGIMLVEPRDTVNTGDGSPNERTVVPVWAD